MTADDRVNPRSRGFRPLGGIGGRAAAATLRPFTDAASVELEQLLSTVLDTEPVQRGLRRAFESEGGRRLIDSLFASGVFDHLVDRLLESPALWRLVDEIADSPAVTAAITQQSLGFADQVGEQVRVRTRRADAWLERAADRLTPGNRDGR